MAEDVWDTRRAFLGKAFLGGLAASLPILMNGGSARADIYTDCLANAYNVYLLDRLAAGQIANPIARAAAFIAAEGAYRAMLVACAALQAGRVVVANATAAANWIAAHPGAVVGTIVIIGGAAFIVSTGGGGALILLPAAAL